MHATGVQHAENYCWMPGKWSLWSSWTAEAKDPHQVSSWGAVYATQRLRPQHGSISHPQKIPSKYWVLKVAGIAKSATTPAHVYWSLIWSCHSDQAITHPLKGRGTARFNIGSMGSPDPHRQPPNHRAVHLSRQASHAVTGSTHPRCKPQSTGARESPCAVSEPPRPKES